MAAIHHWDESFSRPVSVSQQIRSSVLAFDRRRIEPLAALRCAVGVAIPLVTALVLGQLGAAVFITVGAVSVGFGSFQGAYRSRAAVMLLASAAMALSVFVGSLTNGSAVIAIGAAAVWSFAAGLLVAFGPAGAFVGLQSTVAVLLADAYPSDLHGAALRGAMVLTGGLVQTIFVVAIWPLRRFHHERHSVGQVYRGLAGYARSIVARTTLEPPQAAEIPGAAAVHADPHPFARGETLVFQALLDESERIRASLAALALAPDREGTPMAGAAAQLLDELAASIEEGCEPSDTAEAWSGVDGLATRPPGASTSNDLRPQFARLRSQLRAAWDTAHVPSDLAPTRKPGPTRTQKNRADSTDRAPRTIRTVRAIRDSLPVLAANLSLSSSVFRHALRLAFAVAAATAIYRFGGIPRGYWMSMTTLLVVKPEFRETFVTGTARIIGTLLGGGLATLLVLALGHHHGVLAALLIGCVWLGYALFRASYALFTICFTGYVVLLLTLSGLAGPLAAEYRIVNTIAGGLLGLLVYAAWPTWESGRAREALATLVDALAANARILVGALIDPVEWDYGRLRASGNRARLARSNAEASIERMLGEPEINRRIEPQLALGILAATRRYALGALALHAQLTERPIRPRPSLAAFRCQIVAGLERVSVSLRGDIADSNDVPQEPALFEDDEDIDAETNLMADSVSTMRALLGAAPSN